MRTWDGIVEGSSEGIYRLCRVDVQGYIISATLIWVGVKRRFSRDGYRKVEKVS